MSSATPTPNDDVIVLLNGTRLEALAGDDTVDGSAEADVIFGGEGDDVIRAQLGDDRVGGQEGDDFLSGGGGDDLVVGGSDNDVLRGGVGSDRFLFDPTNPMEGDDLIRDLNIAAGDRILLNVGDLLRSAPGITELTGDPEALEATDLDFDPDWTIGQSPDGFVVVGHPTGSITIEGLPFNPALTFADLLPAIELRRAEIGSGNDDDLSGSAIVDFLDGREGDDRLDGLEGDDLLVGRGGEDLLLGRDGDDQLEGGAGDDALGGGAGDDLLAGQDGDDLLRGGPGQDRFLFDPSNLQEGDDRIADFAVGEDLLVLRAADIANATSAILGGLANGDDSRVADPVALLSALDASEEWEIFGAPGSNTLSVRHPGGTIEFEGLAFAGQRFVDLAAAFDVPALNLQNGGIGEDRLDGGRFADLLNGGAGDDVALGNLGRDLMVGGAGDDFLSGGGDDDRLIGGDGDDVLRGGVGADRFHFDPSNANEGDDLIRDLNLAQGDRLVLNAADILRSAPGVESAAVGGNPAVLEAADLDSDPAWTIGESADGFVVVGHPGGTITLEGLAFSPALTFADLLPAIEIAGLQSGTAGNDGDLAGSDNDDLIDGAAGNDRADGKGGDDLLLGGAGDDFLLGRDGEDLLKGGADDDLLSGGAGDDLIAGESGDDNLRGGPGMDGFVFDPSNLAEGDDLIQDFTLGEDRLVLQAADIVRATPEILSALAGGDASAIADPVALLTALDASLAWDIVGAPGSNNLTVVHPGGTIEFEGIGFAGQSFLDLAGAFDVPALNLQNGDGLNNDLIGTRGDDLLNGGDGMDFLAGGNGDDLLVGGDDGDTFRFVPINGNEGDDVIADFDPAEGDKIQLSVADVTASLEPALLADGLQLTDLDASAGWDFQAVAGGDATITHPGGTIALTGLGSALGGVTSFVDFSDDPAGLGLNVLDLVP